MSRAWPCSKWSQNSALLSSFAERQLLGSDTFGRVMEQFDEWLDERDERLHKRLEQQLAAWQKKQEAIKDQLQELKDQQEEAMKDLKDQVQELQQALASGGEKHAGLCANNCLLVQHQIARMLKQCQQWLLTAQ